VPDKKRLREALLDLRDRLDDGEAIHADERAMLAELHDRIEATLDMTGEAAPAERAAVQQEADGLASGFAAQYPQLAATLQRVSEILMGIGL